MNKVSVTNDQVRTGMLRSIAPETGAEYSVVVASPRAEAELWREYLAGADASYHRHGCAAALEYDEVAGGEGTAMFFAVLDTEGKEIARREGEAEWDSDLARAEIDKALKGAQ